jgi:hypothetical protein
MERKKGQSPNQIQRHSIGSDSELLSGGEYKPSNRNPQNGWGDFFTHKNITIILQIILALTQIG